MRFENLYFVKNLLDLKYRLGPHAFLIVKELISASKNDNSLTTIILSATLIDVIKNENSEVFQNLTGVEINMAFSSREVN